MLFVRHGPRGRNNHSRVPQRLDGEIMTNVYPHTHLLRFYIENHGLPCKIVTSAYQRTRGTAQLLQDFVQKEHGVTLPIEVDNRVGEYLGGVRNVVYTDFHPSTYHFRPIRDENRGSFLQRARDFPSERGVWYVSHSYWISTHLEKYGVEIPSSEIPEFHAIMYEES